MQSLWLARRGSPKDEGKDLRATSILKRNIASTILNVAACRPSGPCALKFSAQSRMICNVTPPILEASVRVAPS
jgi:hypothetical protein